MNLMAIVFGCGGGDCVKKTALWLVLPKSLCSGNLSWKTWPSNCFQSPVMTHPLDARDASARLLMDPTFEGCPLITCSGWCSQATAKSSRESLVPGAGHWLDQFCKKRQREHKAGGAI